MSAGVKRVAQVLGMLPVAAGVAIAVYFLSWKGALGGFAAYALLAQARDAIGRRRDARAAFAAWGCYLDPGFTGKITYKTTAKPAPRVTGSGDEGDGIFMMDAWMLADGALVDCFKGCRFEPTPDGRYLAARCDEQGAAFTVYDQAQHVSYHYGEVDAPRLLAQLFSTEAGANASALAAVLGRAQPTPLVAWRGLHLPEEYMPDFPDDVLRKELTPRLTLTATLAVPQDCSTVEDPTDVFLDPVRRIGVNGFATPYYCANLDDAIGSEDGVCLFVKGHTIDADFMGAEGRWYYRGSEGAWSALDDLLFDGEGERCGSLMRIKSLSATSAVFAIDPPVGAMRSAFVQASSRALPFEVAIDCTSVPATCEVPLQKFV